MSSRNSSSSDSLQASPTVVAATEVVAQLDRVLTSETFAQSPRAAAFLKFVVDETLAGRSEFKARTISIAVFQRDPHDSVEDHSIVRMQAGRLRRKLDQYYEREGAQDPVRIFIPTGSYVPIFRPHTPSKVRSTSASSNGSVSVRRDGRPRIAVLPLANRNDSQDHDYFGDGLSEELSAQLSRFQGLAVLAYWRAAQLRNALAEVQQIGDDLDLDFIVTGSVARSGKRVRVSIQCVELATENQVWAQHFDRKLTVNDLFDVQDEIVGHVVSCVADNYGSIPQTLFEASRGKAVDQLTAYEAILANHHYVRCLDKQTHDRTRTALEHAVEIEPSYALAWAMLSALYCDIHAFATSELDDALVRADEFSQRAISLDQKCQHAYYASAYVGTLTRDRRRVIAACDKIQTLNPNAAFMVGATSVWLGLAGDFDKAFPLLDRSIDLNPHHPGWFHLMRWLYAFEQEEYEGALTAAHEFGMPKFFWDPLIRAACLERLGRHGEAEMAYQEVVDLCPDFSGRPEHYVGCLIHSDETRATILDGLRVAGLS
jgi:adenylate cyclase